MQLTEQQVDEVLGKIAEMIQQGTRPLDAVREWVEESGSDMSARVVMRTIRKNHQSRLFPTVLPFRVNIMTERFCGVEGISAEDCDSLIAALQDAVVTVEAKKANLS